MKARKGRTGALASDLTIDGDVIVDLWAGIKSFALGVRGVATVYLRDYDPGASSHTEIASGSVFDRDWQGGSGTFVKKVILVPGVSYTIPAANELEVRLMVEGFSADSMWIAYDTTAYQSAVKLTSVVSAAPPPPAVTIAADDFESGGFTGGTGWLAAWATTAPSDVNGLNTPFEGPSTWRSARARR